MEIGTRQQQVHRVIWRRNRFYFSGCTGGGVIRSGAKWFRKIRRKEFDLGFFFLKRRMVHAIGRFLYIKRRDLLVLHAIRLLTHACFKLFEKYSYSSSVILDGFISISTTSLNIFVTPSWPAMTWLFFLKKESKKRFFFSIFLVAQLTPRQINKREIGRPRDCIHVNWNWNIPVNWNSSRLSQGYLMVCSD